MNQLYRYICGIHYNTLHNNRAYSSYIPKICKNSVIESKHTVSIPFHEKLS